MNHISKHEKDLETLITTFILRIGLALKIIEKNKKEKKQMLLRNEIYSLLRIIEELIG